MDDEYFTLFCPIYKKITEIRNDVNHGGFRKNSYSPELIKEKLEMSYEEIKSIIEKTKWFHQIDIENLRIYLRI